MLLDPRIAGAVVAGGEDIDAGGEAGDPEDKELVHSVGRADGGQRVFADDIAHDKSVHPAVELLEQAA